LDKKASPGQCTCKAPARNFCFPVQSGGNFYLRDDLLLELLVRLLPDEGPAALLPDPDELR
jgi:hypothetical protein